MRSEVIALAAMLCVAVTACGPSAEQIERTRVEAFIEAAKADVASQMLDPTSVQFRKIEITKAGDADVVCGEVNARNSFGGYVGFGGFTSKRLESGAFETKISNDKLGFEDVEMCLPIIEEWMTAYSKDPNSPEAFNLQAISCSTAIKDRQFWNDAVKMCAAAKPLPTEVGS